MLPLLYFSSSEKQNSWTIFSWDNLFIPYVMNVHVNGFPFILKLAKIVLFSILPLVYTNINPVPLAILIVVGSSNTKN